MTAQFGGVIRALWRAALAALLLCALLVALCSAGVLPWPHRAVHLKKIRATEGFGFTSRLPAPWRGFAFVPESGILTEDGRALMPVNGNAEVREKGMGAFRVGNNRVLFSTSDGSDPLTNGRAYTLTIDSAVARSPRPWLLLGGLLAALLLYGGKVPALLASIRRSAMETAAPVRPISAQSWALGLFLAALAIRAGFLWMNPDFSDGSMSIRGTPFSDARDWFVMAKSTARGGGVDSTYPGMRALYPMFLANFLTWFGDSVSLAKGLQTLIGAASAALIFLLLRRAMPLWPALAAALFFALDPRQVTQAGKLMTEPLGLLLILLSAWCMVIGGERRRRAMLFAAGAFFACANLARPLTLFAFPLFTALIAANAWLRAARRWRMALLHSAAFALGTVVCLAPWIVRERVVHGIWSISYNSASALFAASTPEFGVWGGGVEELSSKAGVANEVKARYDFFQARFRENLKKYPGFYASNVAGSLGRGAVSCMNVSPAIRGAAVGALGILCVISFRRGGLRIVLPALISTMLVLGIPNAEWALAFAVVGAAFALWWRLFPGAVLLVCHFAGLLGSALFGNPDLQRVRLLIDWAEAGWTFAGAFAIGGAAVALAARIPFPAALGLAKGAGRDAADAPPAAWLRRLGAAFAAFLLVSTGRLVFLNVFSVPPPLPRPPFSDAQRTAFLLEFAARFPAWQRLADPALMAAPHIWKRRAFVEFAEVEKEVYRFPANFGVREWSGRFEPRPHEHTGFNLRGLGVSFSGVVWADLAGEIPPSIRGVNCLVIGLTKHREAIAAYLENSIEAVAIVPAPDFKPDFARAVVAPVFPETQTLLEAPAAQ